MGKDFLQLRDQGCRGAWELLQRARQALNVNAYGGANSGEACAFLPGENGIAAPRVALCFAPASGKSGESMRSLWRKAVCHLGGQSLDVAFPEGGEEAIVAALLADHAFGNADILVTGGFEPGLLRALASSTPLPVINAGNAEARPCEALAEVLAVSMWRDASAGREMALESLRLGWVGRADGPEGGLALSLLDTALCFHHELFMAFPEGHGPQSDPLDFAMSAGAKIFLSYDPVPAVEDCHELIAAPWHDTEQGNAGGIGLTPRHPLVSDAAVMEAAAGIAVHALASDVSEFIPDGPAQSCPSREMCLLACQAAAVSMLIGPAVRD